MAQCLSPTYPERCASKFCAGKCKKFLRISHIRPGGESPGGTWEHLGTWRRLGGTCVQIHSVYRCLSSRPGVSSAREHPDHQRLPRLRTKVGKRPVGELAEPLWIFYLTARTPTAKLFGELQFSTSSQNYINSHYVVKLLPTSSSLFRLHRRVNSYIIEQDASLAAGCMSCQRMPALS